MVTFPMVWTVLWAVTTVSEQIRPSCQYHKYRHFLNCRGRALIHVPSDKFPVDALGIDLSNNSIRGIVDGAFSNVPSLEFLDLSGNLLTFFYPAAFQGLRQLLVLNISRIQLYFSDNLSTDLFVPLENLKVLKIGLFVDPNIDVILGALKNLTTLDILLPREFTFTNGFGALTKLNRISTFGARVVEQDAEANTDCHLGTLQKSALEVFGNISVKELRLVKCGIEVIERGALDHMTSLELLDLSYNPKLGLRDALQSLRGLRGNMMTSISLVYLNGFFMREYCELNYTDFAYLRNICVRSLDLSQNYISFAENYDWSTDIVFRHDCLESLNISYHTLNLFGPGAKPFYKAANRLKDLDISKGYNIRYQRRKIGRGATVVMFNSIECFLPPNLLRLSVSGFHGNTGFSAGIYFKPNTDLRYLEAANMKVIFGCYRPLARGVANLTHLDISGSTCEDIDSKYFQYIEKLTTLKLSDSPKLNISLMSKEPFSLLYDLQSVDLSESQLVDLNPALFKHNKRLASINLAKNRLQRLPKALWMIPRLQKLDLTSNSFSYFTDDEMKLMEGWMTQADPRRPFRLLVSDNQFQCSCDTVLFIRWIIRWKRNLDAQMTYWCLLPNGNRTSLRDFEVHLRDFEVKCVSHTYLIIAVVGTLCLLLLILLLAGIYRYRSNLRYWLYTRLHPPEDMFVNHDFVYDAFVAYTSDDYEWMIGHLHPNLELSDDPIQLCLHDRDFIPGKPIHENIVDKMRESRKLVLIISPGFLSSTYGPLEIEYAGMKSLEEGRDDIIVCVLMEEIPARQMPRALRNLWNKITFLKWTPNPQEQRIFWRNLRAALRINRG